MDPFVLRAMGGVQAVERLRTTGIMEHHNYNLSYTKMQSTPLNRTTLVPG